MISVHPTADHIYLVFLLVYCDQSSPSCYYFRLAAGYVIVAIEMLRWQLYCYMRSVFSQGFKASRELFIENIYLFTHIYYPDTAILYAATWRCFVAMAAMLVVMAAMLVVMTAMLAVIAAMLVVMAAILVANHCMCSVDTGMMPFIASTLYMYTIQTSLYDINYFNQNTWVFQMHSTDAFLHFPDFVDYSLAECRRAVVRECRAHYVHPLNVLW